LLVLGPLSHLLFGDKFAIPLSLVVAVLCVVSSGSRTASRMLPRPHSFRIVSFLGLAVLGTIATAVVLVGAIIGAHWGLPGIIYGSLIGWVLRTLTYAVRVYAFIRPSTESALMFTRIRAEVPKRSQ
jgi:hypothetical protein